MARGVLLNDIQLNNQGVTLFNAATPTQYSLVPNGILGVPTVAITIALTITAACSAVAIICCSNCIVSVFEHFNINIYDGSLKSFLICIPSLIFASWLLVRLARRSAQIAETTTTATTTK